MSEHECSTCGDWTHSRNEECEHCEHGWLRYNCNNCGEFVDEANDYAKVYNNKTHNKCVYCRANLCYDCVSCSDCYLANRTLEQEYEDALQAVEDANKNLKEVEKKLMEKKREEGERKAAEENDVTSEYFAKKSFHCDGCYKEVFPLVDGYKLCAKKGEYLHRLCTKCTQCNYC